MTEKKTAVLKAIQNLVDAITRDLQDIPASKAKSRRELLELFIQNDKYAVIGLEINRIMVEMCTGKSLEGLENTIRPKVSPKYVQLKERINSTSITIEQFETQFTNALIIAYGEKFCKSLMSDTMKLEQISIEDCTNP